MCIVHEPVSGGVGVPCLEIISWISCEFVFFDSACRSHVPSKCCHELPPGVGQPSWLMPSHLLSRLWGEICSLAMKSESSRGQEAGAGEIPSALLQSQLCTRVTNTLGSTLSAAYLCALPAGPSAASWDRGEIPS